MPVRSFRVVCTFLRPHELAYLKGVSRATSSKICEINTDQQTAWGRWARRHAPPNTERRERQPGILGFDLSEYESLSCETLVELLGQTDGIVGFRKANAGRQAGGKGKGRGAAGDDNGQQEEEGGSRLSEGASVNQPPRPTSSASQRSRAVVAAGGSGWCVTGLRITSLRMVLGTRGVGGLRTPWLHTVHARNLVDYGLCTSNSELRLLCEIISDLPALTDLDLSGNNFHQHCVAMERRRPRASSTAMSSHDSPFHRIGFHSNRGTWRGVRPRHEANRCPCMDGELGSTGCAELAALVVTPTLRTLNLSGTGLGGATLSPAQAADNALIFGLFSHAFCASQSVTALDLSNNLSLGPRCAGVLADTMCGGGCRQLVKLDLSGNYSLMRPNTVGSYSRSGYQAMHPRYTPDYHEMVDVPFMRLCSAVHRHSHIVDLRFEAAQLLAPWAHWQYYGYGSTPFDMIPGLFDDALVELVSTPSLRSLGLRDNASAAIGQDMPHHKQYTRRWEVICKAIQAAGSLTDLDLSHNNIKSDLTDLIATTLLKTPSLVRLNLAQNQIGGSYMHNWPEGSDAVYGLHACSHRSPLVDGAGADTEVDEVVAVRRLAEAVSASAYSTAEIFSMDLDGGLGVVAGGGGGGGGGGGLDGGTGVGRSKSFCSPRLEVMDIRGNNLGPVSLGMLRELGGVVLV